MLSPEIQMHLRAMSRLIYVVTQEEDKFIVALRQHLAKSLESTWVFNQAFGLKTITDYIEDWTGQKHEESKGLMDITDVLIKMYKDAPDKVCYHYVLMDPEVIFRNDFLVRRLLNIVHCQANYLKTVKIIILIGPRRTIPERLAPYTEVVHDMGLSGEEIVRTVQEVMYNINAKKSGAAASADRPSVPMPSDPETMFKGMPHYGILASMAQSIAQTKKDPDPNKRFRIDPKVISDYRRKILRKTDLVQHVDTGDFSFDQVGGVSRFKQWCLEMRAAWTPEGRKFGLKPPKGVLNVGVWGCGKSISVKAMGAAWGLPILQLEMGKLRHGEVGRSENNVYQVVDILERLSPCLCWIDEAEKSLSGGQSSGQTDSGTMSRMIGILSTWMQETTAPICLAMTANSVNTLPVEFINRTDERFFFDAPNKQERIEILKILLSERGQEPESYNLDRLSDASEKMVGREMYQAISATLVRSFNAGLDQLNEDILHESLVHKPRLIRTMADEIETLKTWVGFDPESQDGIRARYASAPTERKGGLKMVGA